MEQRDLAKSINVDGDITSLVALGDTLLVFTKDAEHRVKSPETLDPDRANPNMPWTNSKYSNFGSSNQIVARTLLQTNEMLKSANIKNIDSKKSVLNIVNEIKDALLECDTLYTELREELDIWEQKLNKAQSLAQITSSMPQVDRLEKRCGAFLISMTHAIRSISSIPFFFGITNSKGKNFDCLLSKLGAEHIEFKKFLYEYRDEIKLLTTLRNKHEHSDARDNLHTVINNITLTPDISVSFPTWHLSNEKPRFILQDMHKIIGFLLQMAESVFCHSIMLSVNRNLPYFIEKIDPDKPIVLKLRLG